MIYSSKVFSLVGGIGGEPDDGMTFLFVSFLFLLSIWIYITILK